MFSLWALMWLIMINAVMIWKRLFAPCCFFLTNRRLFSTSFLLKPKRSPPFTTSASSFRPALFVAAHPLPDPSTPTPVSACSDLFSSLFSYSCLPLFNSVPLVVHSLCFIRARTFTFASSSPSVCFLYWVKVACRCWCCRRSDKGQKLKEKCLQTCSAGVSVFVRWSLGCFFTWAHQTGTEEELLVSEVSGQTVNMNPDVSDLSGMFLLFGKILWTDAIFWLLHLLFEGIFSSRV